MYLGRVYDDLVADHCVLVSVARRMISYSAERYPIALTEACLRMCSGLEAKGMKVGEVR